MATNSEEKSCPAFQGRADAGRVLASRLMRFAARPDVVVLAVSSGGVPVGFEIAQAVVAPLDVILVRNLPAPGHPDIVMGTLASGGVLMLNPDVVHEFNIPDEQIQAVVTREQQELEHWERRYRVDRPTPNIRGKTVILVDDGLAAPSNMPAATRAVRDQHPYWLILAVPVVTSALKEELKGEFDELVCVVEVSDRYFVSQCYRHLPAVWDDEVRELLDRIAQQRRTA